MQVEPQDLMGERREWGRRGVIDWATTATIYYYYYYYYYYYRHEHSRYCGLAVDRSAAGHA